MALGSFTLGADGWLGASGTGLFTSDLGGPEFTPDTSPSTSAIGGAADIATGASWVSSPVAPPVQAERETTAPKQVVSRSKDIDADIQINRQRRLCHTRPRRATLSIQCALDAEADECQNWTPAYKSRRLLPLSVTSSTHLQQFRTTAKTPHHSQPISVH